jgi:hypothetical protein
MRRVANPGAFRKEGGPAVSALHSRIVGPFPRRQARFDLQPRPLQCFIMVLIDNPSDSKIDRWLRKQPPRVELALRYSLIPRDWAYSYRVALVPPFVL